MNRMRAPDRAAASRAELTVYDLLGQPVVTLVRGPLPPGEHLVRWDGRDEAGRKLASGLYVYRLDAGSRALMRKLLLVQ